MERVLQVLLLSGDASLGRELESALRDLPDEARIAVHVESDQRRGIEHAVNRSVDLVLLELDADVEETRRVAAEIRGGPSEPARMGDGDKREFVSTLRGEQNGH